MSDHVTKFVPPTQPPVVKWGGNVPWGFNVTPKSATVKSTVNQNDFPHVSILIVGIILITIAILQTYYLFRKKIGTDKSSPNFPPETEIHSKKGGMH